MLKEHKNNLVPLNQIQTPYLDCDLDLPPYVDQSSLGIDLRTVRFLQRLGGIDRVSIREDYSQSKSLYQASSTNTMDGILSSFRRVKGLVKVNTDEINRRILEDKSWQGVGSQEAWAYYLDKSVKSGITSLGYRNTLGIKGTDLTSFVGVSMIPLAFVHSMSHMVVQSSEISYYLGIAGSYLLGSAFDSLFINTALHVADYRTRFSLVLFGPQVDRAALIKLISLPRMIKALPKQ